jgi:hypothetical protein
MLVALDESTKIQRRKWSWTSLQEDRAAKVLEVVNDLEDYWPLTLRQIYYRLVAAGHIENTKSQYNLLSKLIKWMRIDDRLPWAVLEDRTRKVTNKRGVESLEEYIEEEIGYILNGYERCLVQGQDKYVEVWTEKDALASIFENTVYPYCIRAVVCRGYKSVTFISDFFNRAGEALNKGQTPTVLYFGDLDPSGMQMFEATIQTLEDEMGLTGVEYKRVALNLGQVAEFNLPHKPDAAKKTDTRYKRYVKQYGRIAVELDALHPAQLKDLIEDAIQSEIDLNDFADEQRREVIDRARLKVLRGKVVGFIHHEIEMFD